MTDYTRAETRISLQNAAPRRKADKTRSAWDFLRGAGYRVVKEIFDFFSSFFLSLFLSPLMIFVALLIVSRDFGNPIYRQKRVGKDGAPFYIYKFRSMRKGADDLESALTPEQLCAYRREYKLERDPRMIGYRGDGKLCFGERLRQWSLDELPQIFFNICLFGNMSVVGPRPVLASELREYYTPEEQRRLLSVKPGLTGYWQAYARNDVGYQDGRRQAMELLYVERRSLRFDAQILCKTLEAVWRKRGAK